jgi:hypothetical protein
MLEDLPRLVISFVVILLVGVVGLGLAQQAMDTVKFAPDATFNTTAQNLAGSIDDAFGWLPMLILAAIGGIAIAYVFGFTNIMNRPQ